MAFKDRFDTLLINDNIEVAKNEFLKKLNEIMEGAKMGIKTIPLRSIEEKVDNVYEAVVVMSGQAKRY